MKDIINYALSSMAVLMSTSALIFTVIFQKKERKRNIRLMLTTNLNEIAKVNVEIANLKKEENAEEPNILKVRKNLNLQRSIRIIDADFLIQQKPEIMTCVDCMLMASTYQDLGNPDKADYYWLESILKAESETDRHICTREYACFLFMRNLTEEGRKQFDKALEIKGNGSDDDLGMLVDTYLAWAALEKSFEQLQSYSELVGKAGHVAKQIKQKEKRENMHKRIDMLHGKEINAQSK